MNRWLANAVVAVTLLGSSSALWAQDLSAQVQVGPPPLHRTAVPAPNLSAEDLEKTGDALRMEKNYLDALDYYRAALAKQPSGAVYNKIGIIELTLQRYSDAKKSFGRAVKIDRQNADFVNNLGVSYYFQKDYRRAVKLYSRAIELRNDSASFYSNLGTVYFTRQEYDKAATAYGNALQLDPEVFERTSSFGISAQMSSPQDRARYFYVVARLYAHQGKTERALEYLRKAMEEGYKDINRVFQEKEFAELRKDPRFTVLMASRPLAITQ
jgi:tetratricopeptide (TPR) repeat protein